MNWYTAKIIFQITCGDGNHQPQFDEQLRLINANNKQEALHKARTIGISEEESFLNNSGELVRWTFIALTELIEIQELKDGVEFFSKIEEPENTAHYINSIQCKEQDIENKINCIPVVY